ncbi:MAG: hypothetical protein JRJ03_00395 [Deltaproteobacteria bacterium]|nr:hypothetical protein [Deltaproteobacteria bacterium]
MASAINTISMNESGEDNRHIFIVMHSVFYHTSSRDCFSCVDLPHLRQLLHDKQSRITKVITLIDDIYDCWRRLKGPGQLFSSSGDIVQAILDLLLLLHWRSVEIFASEQLAAQLNVPHFVLAVKHPLSVAYDLLFSPKKTAYVAHPITEVRVLERLGKAEEAKRIKEEIQYLTRLILSSNAILPFFPTTIDELIIKENPTNSGIFLPELEQRWPFFDPRESLFVPPENSLPLPFDLPFLKTKNGEDKLHEKAISSLLKALQGTIASQLDSRDRKLVEQSKRLIAWRPCFNGKLSGGVSSEILHRNKLIECSLSTSDESKAFVFIQLEDLGLFRIESIPDMLESHQAQFLDRIELDSLAEKFNEPLFNKLAQQTGQISGDQLQKAIDPENLIRFPLPLEERSALGPDRAVAERAECARKWQEIAGEVNQLVPQFDFLDTDEVIYQEYYAVPEFVRKIESTLVQV